MRRWIIIIPVIAIALAIAISFLSDLYVDWLWFASVHYLPVFRTILIAKTAAFLAVFLFPRWSFGHPGRSR